MKLKFELEKTYKSLEEKNELLIAQMCKNFGNTQQNLPNFKLPAIVTDKGFQGKQSLMGMQTDVLGSDVVYQAGLGSG